MNRFVFTAILTLGLTFAFLAQAQTTSSNEEATIINTFLGLPAYPDSRIVETEDRDDRDSETRFESDASLQDIYAFFHDFLINAGWERVELEEEGDEIEAKYRLDDLELELELERKDPGVFELDIDIDD